MQVRSGSKGSAAVWIRRQGKSKACEIERTRGLAVEATAHLFYFDECRLHLIPRIYAMCMSGGG